MEKHGITEVESLVGKPAPEIYSAEASLYVLEAGVALLEAQKADFLYLSTTDYMQHTYEPEAEPSLKFYEGIDKALGQTATNRSQHRDHRRSWHERQAVFGRDSQCYLSGIGHQGSIEPGYHRHSPDYRSVCGPSWSPWLVCRPSLSGCVLSPTHRVMVPETARNHGSLSQRNRIAKIRAAPRSFGGLGHPFREGCGPWKNTRTPRLECP